MRVYVLKGDEKGVLQNVPAFEVRIEYEETHGLLSAQFRLLGSYKGKKYYYRIFDAGNELGVTKKDISSGIIYK